MMITVIIPVYNESASIHIPIVSLIKQTFYDFEVIIIDDGSNDNSAQIIENLIYHDDRFKLVKQTNKGVSSARNIGLNMAKGRYITFLDGDDYYDETFLSKMYNQIISDNYDICYCGYNRVDGESISPLRFTFSKKDVLLKYFGHRIIVPTTGWMIKKELILKNNLSFCDQLSWGEDILFFAKSISRTDRITFVAEYLSYYRVNHSQQQLSAFTLEKNDLDYQVYELLINDKVISQNLKAVNILKFYKLQGQIVYRLLKATKIGLSMEVINYYYEKYDYLISPNKFVNGLRSFKLLINKYILYYKIKKYKKI